MILFFILATAGFLWPLITHLDGTLPDWGDPADSSWRIGVIAGQVEHDPLHLYRTAAFYPLPNGLALDELLTGQGLLAAPIIWLTGSPPLAFNLLVFLSYALSGLAMWALVRDLTGSSAAGLVAGLIFAFSPWHIGQVGHLGLGAQQWMVLALLFLRRFLRGSGAFGVNRRALLNLALFGLCAVLQALVAGYYAYFEVILFGCYLVYYVLAEGRQHGRRLLAQGGLLAATALVGAGLLLPFIVPFIQAQQQFGFSRSLTEAAYWSVAPTSLLRTDPRSLLYAPIEVGLLGLQTSSERALYPGLIALGLALVGLFALRSASQPPVDPSALRSPQSAIKRGERWVFAAVALIGLVLSFGPAFHADIYQRDLGGPPLPYAWLYTLLPGFDALRVPTRFGQLFMLGLAVLAGYGILDFRFWILDFRSRVGNSKIQNPKSKIGLAVVLGLIALEYWAPGLPAVPTPSGAATPPVYRWLAGREAAQALAPDSPLLELPMSSGDQPINTSPIDLMYGLTHGRPLLNGSANIIPPGYDRLFYEMRRFPAPGTLDLAEGLGVQALLVHTGQLPADRRAVLAQIAGPGGRLQPLATFPDLPNDPAGQAVVYRLQPDPARIAGLSAAIPSGADVLLADHPGHRRLLTAVLPRLLTPAHHYYIAYYTIYNSLLPDTQPAVVGRTYPYAIFYSDPDSAGEPAKWGYTAADRVDIGPNDLLMLYHKGP